MSSEMRECPFCGNQPRSGWQGTGVPGMDDCGYWGIDCCNAFAHADTEAEALAQWNRRSDAPNGSWLWCKLMDFCQKRRFPPAEFNDLFAIVTEAHELNNRALLARTEAGADGAIDSRAAFERWAKPQGYRLHIRDIPGSARLGQYGDDSTQAAWEAWTASRATHPQDASGDAEVRELRRVLNKLADYWIAITRDKDVAHRDRAIIDAYDKGLTKCAAELRAAMQAKEAK